MKRVAVDVARLSDIPALEKALGGKFLQTEILPSGKAEVTILPVASLEFFVNVWNCQAELVLAHGGDCTPAEEVLELDAELLEELVNQVVYDDNDGAINLSGQYFPQSKESLALFGRLIETADAGRSVWLCEGCAAAE